MTLALTLTLTLALVLTTNESTIFCPNQTNYSSGQQLNVNTETSLCEISLNITF